MAETPQRTAPGAGATDAGARERSRRTFRWDCLHGALAGGHDHNVLVTFGLIVANRVLDAPAVVKALIPVAFPLGLLLNPFVFSWAARVFSGKVRVGSLAFACSALTALAFVALALVPAPEGTEAGAVTLGLFTAFSLLAPMLLAQRQPFVTEIYSRNYLPHERGQRLSRVFILASLSVIAFSQILSWLMELDERLYPALYGVMACAALGAGYAIHRMPTQPISRDNVRGAWSNLGLAWRDRLFGWMLCSWMLMGIGNLMSLPLRVEYAANPDYELGFTVVQIAALTILIPAVMRLATSVLWGRVFDRVHFVKVRIAINICFMLSILIYFNTSSFAWMALGSVLLGTAFGGGALAWNLWITKIAPTEKVSSYMTVHTALTGARGVASPLVGYFLFKAYSPALLSWIAGGLVLASILMFAGILRHPRVE